METVENDCRHPDCVYHSGKNVSLKTCDYILIEHKPRGCSISECTRYRTGKRRRGPQKRYEFKYEIV